MKNFAKSLLKYLIITVVIYFGTVVAISSFKLKSFGFEPKYMLDPLVLGIAFFSLAGLLVYKLLRIMDGKDKKKNKGDIDKVTDARGKQVDQYFDKDFVTDEDLKKVKAFNYNTLSSLKSCSKDGILVRAEEKGNTI